MAAFGFRENGSLHPCCGKVRPSSPHHRQHPRCRGSDSFACTAPSFSRITPPSFTSAPQRYYPTPKPMQKRASQPPRLGNLSLPSSPTMSRSSSRLSLASLNPRYNSSKESLLVSSSAHPAAVAIAGGSKQDGTASSSEPTIFGVKLKYISYVHTFLSFSQY